MRTTNRARSIGLLFAVAALVVIMLLSVAIGSRPISVSAVFTALLGGSDPNTHYVVWDLRGPRTLIGLVAGAALGVAGALMQALTRNPLADPGLLGVNAGAAAAAALSISIFGFTTLQSFIWFAFAGAAIAGTVLYLLAGGRAAASPVRLALAGTAISAALTGLTQAAMLLNSQTLDQMRFWTVGSLSRIDQPTLNLVAPIVAVGLLLAIALTRPLNALALGDDAGRALGASLTRTRVLTLITITLLAGATTAAVGPLVFVGLAVPHMVRAITGPDQRWVVPYCMVIAPALLLAADMLGRVVARQELDVGVVTALLGAPVFIFLVRRSRMAKA